METAEGKMYKYPVKEVYNKINIYDDTTHLVNLDKIIEIEIPPITKLKR